MNDTPAKPTLRRLSQENARLLVPWKPLLEPAPPGGFDLIPDYAAAVYQLPRGSVFLAHPVAVPFAYKTQIAGHSTYVVVAREVGDVTFPAWLWRQRMFARGEVIHQVREGYRGELAWLAASKATLMDMEAADAVA